MLPVLYHHMTRTPFLLTYWLSEPVPVLMVSTSSLLIAKNRTATSHITKLFGLRAISRIIKHQTHGGHRMNAEFPRE